MSKMRHCKARSRTHARSHTATQSLAGKDGYVEDEALQGTHARARSRSHSRKDGHVEDEALQGARARARSRSHSHTATKPQTEAGKDGHVEDEALQGTHAHARSLALTQPHSHRQRQAKTAMSKMRHCKARAHARTHAGRQADNHARTPTYSSPAAARTQGACARAECAPAHTHARAPLNGPFNARLSSRTPPHGPP